jgi:uncharacterized protein YgfB (UPF0149 family)
MTADTPFTADDLATLGAAASRQISLMELHGAACGVLAGGNGAAALISLVGEDALTDQASVAEFWQAHCVFALDAEMSFVPLLPDPDAPLVERIDGLARWAASFLAGFSRGRGAAGLRDLPETNREIVQDLAAIAGVDADAGDDNEFDLMELEEFVRVAALLLISDGVEGDTDADQVSH